MPGPGPETRVDDRRQRCRPLCVRLRLVQPLDRRAAPRNPIEIGIEPIVVNLPVTPDHPTKREVDDRRPPPDLDLLGVRQPIPIVDQRSFQPDHDVLEVAIAIGGGRESKMGANHLGSFAIEKEGPNHARVAVVFRANVDGDQDQSAAGAFDRHGIAEPVVIPGWTIRGQWVDHIGHLGSVAQADGGSKIVGHDPEMIPVIDELDGEQRRVAPRPNDLLAPVWSSPIHFHRDLVRLDGSRGKAEIRPQLGAKGDDPAGAGGKRPKAGICERAATTFDRLGNERPGRGVVPGLGREGGGRGGGGAENNPEEDHEPAMHRLGNIVIVVGGLASAALLPGCGGGTRVATDPATEVTERVPPPTRLDSVFVLESGGPQPEDTTVAIAPGASRVIIVRRGAPDNSLFARLVVPADTTGTDSVRLTLRPRPGLYGVDLEVEGGLAAGAELTMSYAVHFAAPEGARARYGSDLGLEKFLFLTQAFPDGRLVFLPTTRPGSDLVTATLPGPGRYLVAAPRS